jgi:TonB family protein
MRNRSTKLATVLTALLIFLWAFPSRAQQTASPPAETQAPVTQPEQVGPVKVSGPVKGPKVSYSVEPKYTEGARQKKLSGIVKLYCWVDEEGKPSHIKVVQGLGMGLDEKAVEALQQFKFQPATRNGRPVKVDLYIDISFQVF